MYIYISIHIYIYLYIYIYIYIYISVERSKDPLPTPLVRLPFIELHGPPKRETLTSMQLLHFGPWLGVLVIA